MIRSCAVASFLLCACTTAFAADADASDEAMGRRVQDLLHAHQADVFGCVAQASGIVKGEMLMRVVVGSDGKAMKADVLKDQTGLPTLGPCLQTKINQWNLASLQAGAGDQVVFPLVFKPEALAKGQKRVLVPMAAQESQGPQRFLIDDQSIGEAPLATIEMTTLAANQALQAKSRKDAEEELVFYVLDGSFKSGPNVVAAGDVLWIGAHTDQPAIAPADKKPLKLLEIRAHGQETGQKVLRGADAKSYPISGGKGTAKLLLDGSGAKIAVDELTGEIGASVPTHKHATSDEELFFIDGTSVTTVGSKVYETAPGDAMRIPANVPHQMKVTAPLRTIQVYAPGGPEQRFKGGDEKPSKKKRK